MPRGYPAGRPRGPRPEQDRQKLREAAPEYQRRPWMELSREILAAANAGDIEEASRLLHEYMLNRAQSPALNSDKRRSR